MADLAINLSISLVEQIISFTNQGINLQRDANDDIDEVKKHLIRLQVIVQSRESSSPRVTQVIAKDLRSLAHHIEDALDNIMLHGPSHSPTQRQLKMVYDFVHRIWHWPSFHEIHKEIRLIQREMKKVFEAIDTNWGDHGEDARADLQHHLSQTIQDAEIVGIEASKQWLVSQLKNNNGDKACGVVVVVGPPGSGKTLLVNSVYRAKQITSHFNSQVSARLLRRFDVGKVLSLLFSQASSHCRDKKTCLTDDVATNLRNNLKGKQYLVFLDDMWSESHWRDIKLALPEESNGSRVVVTTTKMDVATSIATSSSHIHLVEGLKEDESWRLFCRKAFSKEQGECHPYLVDLSKEILDKCEGLPLAISAMGNFLEHRPRLPAEWEKVKENLRAEVESSPQFSDLNSSVEQCYADLNGNLKSCLLYFSLFAEGDYIERARLIRLWVAERFVSQTGEKPAEDVAEECLNELIRRNLVVAIMDFDGRVKTCKVRKFLHYFLTAKSKDEDFAAMLDQPSTKPGESVRRLSVAADSLFNWQLKRVRTCIMLGWALPSGIMKLSDHFSNLKVMDFQGAPLQDFPKCVVDLGLLQYLSLRGSTSISEIPSSIKKLRYLEFLDLKYTSVTRLPDEICSLHNLRHLLVYHYCKGCYITFDTPRGMKMGREIGALTSIQKLTLLKAQNHPKFFHQLGSLTQLQKLGLIDLKRSDGESLCKSLAKMRRLSVLDLQSRNNSEFLDLDHQDSPCNLLQRVYLKGPLQKLPRWIKSLRSLVRIHLRWSRLETSPIDELQGLNNLVELRLADAFVGESLKFGRGAFQKLKVLQLEELAELSNVEVSSQGSMCKLEKLTLCKCGKLMRLPSRIRHHTELKELALYDMPDELTNSLRKGSKDPSKIKVYTSDAAKQKWLPQNP